MKKHDMILFGIGVILIVIGVLSIVFDINPLIRRGDPVPYPDIVYTIPLDGYCSCLSFLSNNRLMEYDCDSETSPMPFSGEFYEKYYYDSTNKTITFTGKGEPDVVVKVLKWSREELSIKVIENNHCRSICRDCSSNHSDTFDYVFRSSDDTETIYLKNDEESLYKWDVSIDDEEL